MTATHRITEQERQEVDDFCQTWPILSGQLPITLPCGFRVDQYHVECGRCRQDIPMNHSWIRRQSMNFAAVGVEVWEVKGVCTNCRTVTGTYARFRSDGTFDTLAGHRWRSGRIGHSKEGAAIRLRQMVRRWLEL